MKNRTTHETFKKKAFAIPGIKEGYDNLEEEFAAIAELINAREKAGKSQKEIAEKMKTTPSVISRIESSLGKKHHSPTLSTLRRYAKALGCKLVIKLVPIEK